MRRPALAGLAALVLAAGCGGGSSQERASPAEIHWLERLARYEDRAAESGRKVGSLYVAVLGGRAESADLERALEPIRRCSQRLRREVGKPPGVRFGESYELMLRGCDHYERSAAAVVRSFHGSPGDALRRAGDEQTHGAETFQQVSREIESLLTANRALPTIGGPSARSRIEPRLSRIASGLARRKAEIRCWSTRDWPQVVGEWGAYIGTRDIAAFAQPNGDRAALAPDTCEELAELLYEGSRPQSGGARDDLAAAVDTLAHESEHLASPAGSEAETECYAMQDIRPVARQLGASRSYAASLAELYWSELYEQLPDAYVSPDCRDGGPWDANRSSSIWP